MEQPQTNVKKSLFRWETSVKGEIGAPASKIWELLTDAARFPSWNSTISSIEGAIALGQKLGIRVPISPRTFTPTVVEFEPNRKMVWRDGFAPMFTGVRTFGLAPLADGGTRFSMSETFTGIMMPLIGRSLPDFVPVFAQYALDLKRAAEMR